MGRGALWFVLSVVVLAVFGGAVPSFAQNVDMGDTFHRVEATARKVVTHYKDSYAVTTTQGTGLVWSQLFTPSGTLVARLNLRLNERRLDAEVEGGQLISAPIEGSYKLTMDWQNAQLRRLWLDGREAVARGLSVSRVSRSWQGPWLRLNVVSGSLSGAQPEFDPDAASTGVETEYDDLTVTTAKTTVVDPRPRTAYATYVTRVSRRTGEYVGMMQWFERDRVITWAFVNGSRGVAPEWRIAGGLRFKPRMAWANVQSAWFARNPPKKSEPAQIAPRVAARMAPPRANLLGRLGEWLSSLPGLQRLSPSRSAIRRNAGYSPAPLTLNRRPSSFGEPLSASAPFAMRQACDGLSDGCTGLHWLDNTVLRECCDDHDRCFERDCTQACTKRSWIFFWQRWDCTLCNIEAVLCFVTVNGGDGNPNPPPDPGQTCQRQSWADWCPPECQTCLDPP